MLALNPFFSQRPTCREHERPGRALLQQC